MKEKIMKIMGGILILLVLVLIGLLIYFGWILNKDNSSSLVSLVILESSLDINLSIKSRFISCNSKIATPKIVIF